jgi:hypothetical protein
MMVADPAKVRRGQVTRPGIKALIRICPIAER